MSDTHEEAFNPKPLSITEKMFFDVVKISIVIQQESGKKNDFECMILT